jgi:hypothetical protein
MDYVTLVKVTALAQLIAGPLAPFESDRLIYKIPIAAGALMMTAALLTLVDLVLEVAQLMSQSIAHNRHRRIVTMLMAQQEILTAAAIYIYVYRRTQKPLWSNMESAVEALVTVATAMLPARTPVTPKTAGVMMSTDARAVVACESLLVAHPYAHRLNFVTHRSFLIETIKRHVIF